MEKYTQTTINGYEIEHEVEEMGDGEFFSSGTISKGEFHACLGCFMQGYPLEDGYGEELEVPDGTFKRIERWVYAQGW
tara:strand:+ start:545 stop:778 length:234 start_codon:yes stop_codon:yes gene_type:complete